jgi:hypothetical protein
MEIVMTDVYLYHFTWCDGATGENRVSVRRGTLEAIKGKGEPLMASQIVVDHTELDGDGFLRAGIGNESSEVNDLTAQIASLELRATSRDSQAQSMNDDTEGRDKYMLSLESRELRREVRTLKSQRCELIADEADDSNGTQAFTQLTGHATPA